MFVLLRSRAGVAIRLRLFDFHAHVAEFSKVLIEGRDWHVLSHRSCGDQAVDKMCLHSLIAVKSVQLDRYPTDLDARAVARKSDISADAQPERRLRGFRRKTFLFPYCWRGSP